MRQHEGRNGCRYTYAGVLTFAPGGAKWAWGGNQGLVEIGQRRAKLLKSIFDSKVADSPEYDVALRMALDAFANVDASEKRMIILTNGDPSLLKPQILDEFKEKGIVIAVVHVTRYGDKYAAAPKQMSLGTGGKYYHIDADRFNVTTVEEIFSRESVGRTPTR